jgi:hypothetical protein
MSSSPYGFAIGRILPSLVQLDRAYPPLCVSDRLAVDVTMFKSTDGETLPVGPMHLRLKQLKHAIAGIKGEPGHLHDTSQWRRHLVGDHPNA